MKKDVKKCRACYGKRYYTYFVGFTIAPDFIGDKRITENPTVKNIACPLCNKNNIRKIKNVKKSIYEENK